MCIPKTVLERPHESRIQQNKLQLLGCPEVGLMRRFEEFTR
jgi:hypothetical protein